MTDGTARIQIIFDAGTTAMTAASPITPATGDEIHWTISYLT